MKVLLIIPAYNEEKCIIDVCKTIDNYNKNNKQKYDYIVINDGSTDNTLDLLKKNRIKHIDLIENLGIGGSVQTGYKYALEKKYDIAIQFDGDGQHDVNYVKNIIEPLLNKEANMCIGSRFVVPGKAGFKSSQSRRIGIKILSTFIKLGTGKRIYDPTSGFRAVDRELIRLFSQKYPTEYPESVSETMILKMKYTIAEVPVKMHERQGGVSSIRSWKNFYFMINVILSIMMTSIRRYK